MSTHTRRIALVLLVLLAMARPSTAQGTAPEKDPCGAPNAGFSFWLSYRVCSIARAVPQESHVEAPTATAGSTALVERAKAPDIFSLALGLVGAGGKTGEDETATSMTVSAFAIRASVTGDNPLNPSVYRRHRNWRRWSFTAGRAEGNGDTPDGRIVGVKGLLIDHRDVSDPANQKRLEAVAASLSSFGVQTGEAFRKALAFVARSLAPDLFTAGMTPMEVARAETQFAQTELSLQKYEETLARLSEDQLTALDRLLADDALRIDAAKRDIAATIRAIRRAPQLALTYQALLRAEDADDEHHFGLAFDVGLASRLAATFNGTFVRTDNPILGQKNVGKVAGQLDFDLQQVANLEGVIKRRGRGPLTVSVAGLGEWHSDDGPNIAKLQVKLTIPLPGMLAGLKLPLSVTVANRTALINEKEVRGNVGFTLDLSKLQNPLGGLRR